jgi:hypothetical protein
MSAKKEVIQTWVSRQYPHDHVAPEKPEVEYYLHLTKKIRDAVMSSISSEL